MTSNLANGFGVLPLVLGVAIFCGLLPGAEALSPHARNPLRVRFVTFNVDFNKSATKIQEDVVKVETRADVIMFQEAKWVTLANYFPASDWSVYQVTNDGDAKRGSAVAYRKSFVKRVVATGLRVGVTPGTCDILTRHINWVDLEFTNDQILRVAALHMPPNRCSNLQTPMADSLAVLVNSTAYPAIVGGDWNFTVEDDPRGVQQKTGLIPKGVGIDGFFYNQDPIEFVSKTEMTGLNVNSDHDPVQMIARVYNISPPVSGIPDWSIYH